MLENVKCENRCLHAISDLLLVGFVSPTLKTLPSWKYGLSAFVFPLRLLYGFLAVPSILFSYFQMSDLLQEVSNDNSTILLMHGHLINKKALTLVTPGELAALSTSWTEGISMILPLAPASIQLCRWLPARIPLKPNNNIELKIRIKFTRSSSSIRWSLWQTRSVYSRCFEVVANSHLRQINAAVTTQIQKR